MVVTVVVTVAVAPVTVFLVVVTVLLVVVTVAIRVRMRLVLLGVRVGVGVRHETTCFFCSTRDDTLGKLVDRHVRWIVMYHELYYAHPPVSQPKPEDRLEPSARKPPRVACQPQWHR